jgi:hypothetical protein
MERLLWQAQLRKHINANAPVACLVAMTKPHSLGENGPSIESVKLRNRRPSLRFILARESKRKESISRKWLELRFISVYHNGSSQQYPRARVAGASQQPPEGRISYLGNSGLALASPFHAAAHPVQVSKLAIQVAQSGERFS